MHVAQETTHQLKDSLLLRYDSLPSQVRLSTPADLEQMKHVESAQIGFSKKGRDVE